MTQTNPQPALTDLDRFTIREALEALPRTYPTTQRLAAILAVSEKLDVHREPLCCRAPDNCPLLLLWQEH